GVGEILTVDDLERIERSNLQRALEKSGWQVAGESGAARLLGMAPSTLASRMKALGVRKAEQAIVRPGVSGLNKSTEVLPALSARNPWRGRPRKAGTAHAMRGDERSPSSADPEGRSYAMMNIETPPQPAPVSRRRVDSSRYARAIENSKRVRWDIDKD